MWEQADYEACLSLVERGLDEAYDRSDDQDRKRDNTACQTSRRSVRRGFVAESLLLASSLAASSASEAAVEGSYTLSSIAIPTAGPVGAGACSMAAKSKPVRAGEAAASAAAPRKM